MALSSETRCCYCIAGCWSPPRHVHVVACVYLGKEEGGGRQEVQVASAKAVSLMIIRL